jgi:hypothetical protein
MHPIRSFTESRAGISELDEGRIQEPNIMRLILLWPNIICRWRDPSDAPKPPLPASPAKLGDSEPEHKSEKSSAQNNVNRPRIMLSTVQGHYNQWNGDVFTLNHLGGDAAQYIEIDPINFEGFSKVSLRFEPIPFINNAGTPKS